MESTAILTTQSIRGLLTKQPWIGTILAGSKTWEIRGSSTEVRGPIALIQLKPAVRRKVRRIIAAG